MAQIQQAWDQARDQLETLRTEVHRASELAKANLQTKFASRDKDKALRDFGEAVWTAMKKGKLQLPPELRGAVKTMLEVEKRVEQQTTSIQDLLAEGTEAADRESNSVVRGGKKR